MTQSPRKPSRPRNPRKTQAKTNSKRNSKRSLKQSQPVTPALTPLNGNAQTFVPNTAPYEHLTMDDFPRNPPPELMKIPVNDIGTGDGLTHKRADKYDKLEARLQENVGGLGALLTSVPFVSADGLVVIARTQPLCASVTALAEVNKQVYDFLVTLLDQSVYFNLAMQVAILGVNIVNNHVKLPIDAQERLHKAGVLVDLEGTAQAMAMAQAYAMGGMVA
jgi:hypothetical protein